MKILVVDDDRMMAKTLAEIFALQGWEVQQAHDGRSAVNAAQKAHFDLVLMDFKMPGMDGVSAYRAMKAADPGVKAVLMTAFATDDTVLTAEREGMLKVLSKPLDIRALLALIAAAQSRQRTVLLVDTDAAFLRTLSEVLRLRGFDTVVARDLAEATRLVRERRPAAILLHMHLGAVAARDAVRAVKDASPDAPLILYSGQPGAEARINGDVPQELVAGYLQKPFAIDQVAGVLNAAVAD